MEHKQFKADNVILSDAGHINFRFAKLNVIDHHGDIIPSGAIENGKMVLMSSWNHTSWGNGLPIGKGIITEQNGYLQFDGDFNLNTESGREHYETVKFNGSLQEYSFGFDTMKTSEQQTDNGDMARVLEKMDVHETSPVLMGAGIDTGTNNIKIHDEKQAIPPHKTPTDDSPWNGPKAEKALKDDQNYAYYRKAYAWLDPKGDKTKKSTYKFIHHEVSADGEPEDANIKACQSGIGILNGARGGTNIPSADRQGVYDHLAKHLKDAGLTPPALKALGTGSVTYQDHAEMIKEDVIDFVERTQSIAAKREDNEKEPVSKKNKADLVEIAEALRKAAIEIEKLTHRDEEDNDFMQIQILAMQSEKRLQGVTYGN